MSLLQEFLAFRDSHTVSSLQVNTRKWEYTKSGTSTKRAILILHGGGTTSDAAWEYIQEFKKHYTVIAPTLPMGVTSVAEAVYALRKILEKEEIEHVHLLGFSLGGMIAQCFIRSYPEMTQDMILFVAMAPSPRVAWYYRWHLLKIFMTPTKMLGSVSKWFLRRQILAEQVKAPEEEREFWVAFFATVVDAGRMNKAGIIASARVLIDFLTNYKFFPKDLKTHPGRILIFEGDKDRLVNAVERKRLRATYPQAKVITLKNSGHFGFGLVKAKPIIARMVRFLES